MRTTSLTMIGLLGACTYDAPALVDVDEPSSIRVAVPAAERGTPDARLPFTLDPIPLTMTLEIIGPDGSPLTAFEGWVEMRLEPGDVVRTELASGEATIGPMVPVHAGRVDGLSVLVARAYADTRIWAEEIGYRPADPATAGCANGMDDDGDGRADFPLDPGCRFGNDDDEGEGSHAIGVSDVVYFANPRLADVQGRTGESPLEGRRVTVDQGEMIVTRITTDGFYVSEAIVDGTGVPTGAADPWGSLFVFNFNTPPFLRVCDRIATMSGSVGEFFGYTELNFPSWRAEDWCRDPGPCTLGTGEVLAGRPCPIPEPALLDATILGTPMMEQHEAALVRVRDAQLPTFLGPGHPPGGGGVFAFEADASNCDLDDSGDVTLDAGSAEAACNDACALDPGCSEWSQFVEFGQYAVRTAGRTINLVSRDALPDFDPTANRGATFAAITGTLRHFSPLGPERGYILEPRCEEDLAAAVGDILPSFAACVSPRTGGPIEVE